MSSRYCAIVASLAVTLGLHCGFPTLSDEQPPTESTAPRSPPRFFFDVGDELEGSSMQSAQTLVAELLAVGGLCRWGGRGAARRCARRAGGHAEVTDSS